MHDIDRIQLEFDTEMDGFETDTFEYEFGGYGGGISSESPFSDAQEMEMATDFLEITDESELDQFLGNLIKKAAKAAGGFIKSPAGQALGGILKSAAKKALPVVGGAVGTAFGGPLGGMLGSKLASGAGSLFGLELEGLSPEDREFEVARRFVKFAGTAAKNVAMSPQTTNHAALAKSAIVDAAKMYAPGILRSMADTMSSSQPRGTFGGVPTNNRQSGQWVRKGHRIIIYGV